MSLSCNLDRSLEDYLEFHTHQNSWRCLVCQREFSMKNNGLRHVRTVHCENEKEQCYLCLKWFKNDVSLAKHARLIHRKGVGSQQSQNTYMH